MFSVRFYKNLILSILALAIIVPSAVAAVLYFKNRDLRNQVPDVPVMAEDVVTVGASEYTPKINLHPGELLAYQQKWPEFRSEFTAFHAEDEDSRIVYLTFDDGPSTETQSILTTLAAHDVKATFFVNGKTNRLLTDALRLTAEQGHCIAMHSFTHRYAYIYASVENFLDDFHRNFVYIQQVTGTPPRIFRFPGGSINAYNFQIYEQLIAEMLRRGFVYYDWNVSGADLTENATPEGVAMTVINAVVARKGSSVVLLHDTGSQITTKALSTIIETLKARGFEFRALDNTVVPPVFAYQS